MPNAARPASRPTYSQTPKVAFPIRLLEGRYRIESELGEGGIATVYLADDLKHERKVALKVLKPELARMECSIRVSHMSLSH